MLLAMRERLPQNEERPVFVRVHHITFMGHISAFFKVPCLGSDLISDARMRYRGVSNGKRWDRQV